MDLRTTKKTRAMQMLQQRDWSRTGAPMSWHNAVAASTPCGSPVCTCSGSRSRAWVGGGTSPAHCCCWRLSGARRRSPCHRRQSRCPAIARPSSSRWTSRCPWPRLTCNRIASPPRSAQRATSSRGCLTASTSVWSRSPGRRRSAVPASQDHAAVAAAVDGLELGNGTAIGEAVFASLQAVTDVLGAQGSDPAPAHVVLLSDGTNTAGRSVQEAAQAAVAAGVPVSTIAYGTQEGTVEVQGQLGNVPVDVPALVQPADSAKGKAYQAANGSELSGVYDSIGYQVGYTTQQRKVGSVFAGLALLAAAGAVGAPMAWSPRGL